MCIGCPDLDSGILGTPQALCTGTAFPKAGLLADTHFQRSVPPFISRSYITGPAAGASSSEAFVPRTPPRLSRRQSTRDRRESRIESGVASTIPMKLKDILALLVSAHSIAPGTSPRHHFIGTPFLARPARRKGCGNFPGTSGTETRPPVACPQEPSP